MIFSTIKTKISFIPSPILFEIFLYFFKLRFARFLKIRFVFHLNMLMFKYFLQCIMNGDNCQRMVAGSSYGDKGEVTGKDLRMVTKFKLVLLWLFPLLSSCQLALSHPLHCLLC